MLSKNQKYCSVCVKNIAQKEKNGGKPPKIQCVICGLSNAAYRRGDGGFVVPLTSLKN